MNSPTAARCARTPPQDANDRPYLTKYCESEEELDRLYAAPSEDGQALMPLGDYGFSRKFGTVIVEQEHRRDRMPSEAGEIGVTCNAACRAGDGAPGGPVPHCCGPRPPERTDAATTTPVAHPDSEQPQEDHQPLRGQGSITVT